MGWGFSRAPKSLNGSRLLRDITVARQMGNPTGAELVRVGFPIHNQPDSVVLTAACQMSEFG